MPELPEVQTTVNGLQEKIAGLVIADVWTDYNSPFHAGKDNIKDPRYFRQFKKKVVGAKVVDISRQAKNILIRLSTGDTILIHMKMTGHIMYGRFVFDLQSKHIGKIKKGAWKPAPDERPALHDPFNRFIHFVISFAGKKFAGTNKNKETTGSAKNTGSHQIVLSDMRKFAKVTLILEKDFAKTLHLSDIGPDPLTTLFTFDVFKERLARRPTGRIKNVLMDQSVIAGIGNIYSDEALWRAGIHPEELVNAIFKSKSPVSGDVLFKKLYMAIRTVLAKGIDFGGDSMSDYRNIDGERGQYQEHHRAYRKTGTRCTMRVGTKACQGIILRKMVGGRSAHFCSVHQRLLKNRQ
jgi:formamidopyrimidine-DNA glycosylase